MIPDEDIEIFQTAIDELRAQGLDEDMVIEQIVIALAVKYDESEDQLDLDPKFIDDALAQLGLSLGGSSDEDDDEDDEVEYDEELKKYPPNTYLLIDGASVLEELDDDTVKKAISEEGARGFEHFTSGLQQVIQITSQDPLEYRVVAQGPDYDEDVDVEQEEVQDDFNPPPAVDTAPVNTDDQTILSILGDKGLLDLIQGSDSPFGIELLDRIDAPGVTLLYDNQRASRIIRILQGVDNGVPIYGDALSDEANIIFPVPGSGSATISATIKRQIEPEMKDNARKSTVRNGLDKLSRVQDAITNLSDVFGFDDPAELEAFFAAWLMKNSTCRLSGIPGTGKTTVINSAAIIMANSYGFSEAARFYPRSVPGRRAPDMNRARYFFPNGMTYDVSYSARGLVETLAAWDNWRFSDWSPVEYDVNGNPRPGFSGAYTYDFEFLRPSAGRMVIHEISADGEETDLDSHTKTVDLSSDEFAKVLYLHIRPSNDVVKKLNETMSPSDVAEFVNRNVRTVDMSMVGGQVTIVHPAGEGEEYSVSGGDEMIKGLLAPIATDLQRFQDAIHRAGHQGTVFRTDLGANEGYYLRQALMRYTYDTRTKPTVTGDYDSNSMESLRSEMLREIGIAKIDNDKRADEILYGMEIQQVSETREGKEVNTFVFDPIPRPIVTQPIKFFNEANRSQAGVEDAVLGLIAEKEVEYRGKTFNSPSFVAWMDTNPHQKANDLAFTDRIDTELFFGTISLGQRNAQLQSRYAGASNAKPDIQLVTRIIESSIERPLRISHLGLGSDSIWRFVENIPFRPPDVTTGYDGLRDIATLSVLFTQRPQLRSTQNVNGPNGTISYEVGGTTFIASDNANPHASPLEDISRASVNDIIDNQEQEMLLYGEGGDDFQPQFPIKRVLGFRFTDSIVKMSRALAFLRGKEYVGRQEIVDALPFCLGHRLGRARGEGGSDSSGISDIQVPSEQEYVRQTLVYGYLLDRVDEGGANITGTFRIWDAFFSYCEQILASSVNYRQFENSILRQLRGQFLSGGQNLTPVHWHLATSVVEREREGITNMHPSHYSTVCSGDSEGDYNYPDVLAHYRKLISRPEKNGRGTAVAMGYNFSAADYYKVRGQIASDPYLFSDDKAHLLGLIESRIEQLCGSDSELGGISNIMAVDDQQEYADDEIIYGTNPQSFPWRTYGDSGGAWGSVLGVAEANSNLLGTGADIPYGWSPAGGGTSAGTLAAMSDQAHRIIFRCAPQVNNRDNDDDRKKRSEQELRLRNHQIPSLRRLLAPLTGSGVLFTISGGLPHTPGTTAPSGVDAAIVNSTFPVEIAGILDDVKTGSPVRMDSFLSAIDELIKFRMSGAGTDKAAARNLLSQGGIMACFDLEHGRGVVSNASSPTEGYIASFLRDMGSDIASSLGRLRLWMRLHEIEGSEGNFVLTFGITSCPASNGEMTVTDDDGNESTVITTNYAGISEVTTYVQNAYTAPFGEDARIYFDSGNLTRDDLVFYDRLLSQAFNSRSGEE